MSPRLVSFDVFDTVLTRACAEPHDLFVQLGARLQTLGLVQEDPVVFAESRSRAEGAARRCDAAGEPTLADIYAQLGRALNWSETQRAAATAEEVALETAAVRPVPAMLTEVAQARQALGRVVFISDNYLPSATVCSWLERAGFWQPGDFLFISAEHKASKGRDAALFRVVARELKADWPGWVHRGDNPHSDEQHPRRLGITGESRPAARLSAHERQLRGPAAFAPVWRSLFAGAARLARLEAPAGIDGQTQRVLWDVGADVAGPLFHGFTDWCLAEAERRGVTDLFFLARDGQILQRIAEKIQTVRPRAVRLHYLPASRLAFGASDSAPLTDESRRLARAFLAQEGLAGNHHAAIVDLGWQGTIQRCLEALLGETGPRPLPGLYLGLIEGRPPAAGWQAGYTNQFAPMPLRHELALCVLLELMARADHGLVTGFIEETDGRIRPRMEEQDEATNAEIRLGQRAILAFVDRVLANGEAGRPGTDAELARAAIGCFRDFHDHPTADEARFWGFLPHANQASGRHFETLCLPPTASAVTRAMLSRRQRPVGWWLPAQAALGQAMLVRGYHALKKIKRAGGSVLRER